MTAARDITCELPAYLTVLDLKKRGLIGRVRVIGVRDDGTSIDVTRDTVMVNRSVMLVRVLRRDERGRLAQTPEGETLTRDLRFADVRIVRP